MNMIQASDALDEVYAELERQHAKFGEQNHEDGTGDREFIKAASRARVDCDDATDDGEVTWRHILLEEVYEALAESDLERLVEELNQVAAVAVQWRLAIQRRGT